MTDETTALHIRKLLDSACVELFASYGVEVQLCEAPWPTSEAPLLFGAMGFIGSKLHGTCLLAAEETLVQGSSPMEGRARDWIGELANQLLGRLKNKLLARGVAVSVSTPVVLSGVRITPLPRGTLRPSRFSSNIGHAMVWLEVEVAEGLVIAFEQPDEQGPEAGILLF